MRKVLVAVAALLLSGCASDAPTDEAAADAAAPGIPGQAVQDESRTMLRFGSGDYEGLLQGDVTFGPTDFCFFECTGNAVQTVDLTSIVPADAPVELAITTSGSAYGELEFVEASAVRYDQDSNGPGSTISALLTRAASGKVLLHFMDGDFVFGQAPTTTYEARSVVRADQLVPYMPASLRLAPGDVVELPGDDVEEAILIDPRGAMTRDATAPFELQANGTAGDYTLLMLGDDATRVLGPNGTSLSARRLSYVLEEPRPLQSGQETAWSFDVATRPVAVGVRLASSAAGGVFPAGSTMTQYEVSVTGPGNVQHVHDADACTPMCTFPLGMSSWGWGSEYLDDSLEPGSYEVSVTYTGNGMTGAAWHVVIA